MRQQLARPNAAVSPSIMLLSTQSCLSRRVGIDHKPTLEQQRLRARSRVPAPRQQVGPGGSPRHTPGALTKDAIELIQALPLGKVVIGGWSLGGIAAQVLIAQAPQLISHAVLIGTAPPGFLAKAGEALFYEIARRETDFEDFVNLFFEPDSGVRRAATERLGSVSLKGRRSVAP